MESHGGRGLKILNMLKDVQVYDQAETVTMDVEVRNIDLKNKVSQAQTLTIDDGSVWSRNANEHGSFLPLIDDDNLKILQDFLFENREPLQEIVVFATDSLEIPKLNLRTRSHPSQICNEGSFDLSNRENIPENIDTLYNSDDSVKDPDFNAENCSSDDSDNQNSSNEKRGRKRKAEPAKWKCNRAKKLRNSGKKYQSKFTGKIVGARCLKPPCVNCKLHCNSKIDQAFREKIFTEYWKMADLSRQREFIIRHMEEIKPQYRYPKNEKARKLNSAYYFEKNGEKVRVCKDFFMATLDINRRTISTSCSKKQDGIMLLDLRGKHGHHKIVDENIKDDIRAHINSIPRIESHYLRAQTKREFIEGGKTIAGIFRDYENKCKSQEKPHGSLTMFTRIFNNEFNLSFFTPKKDQCDLCVAYENSKSELNDEGLLEKFNCHLEEKKISRIEKDKDKGDTDKNVIVACYDLQAALITPRGEVSVFYYKTKLSTYNFSVYEFKSNEAICNVWHEGEASRGSNEIASCVLKYIEEKASSTQEDLHFIFYSDNCSGQQKNRYVFIMYMYAVCKFENVKSITHKFLIRGHTQNEGDAVHSTIEKEISRALRSGPIYTPSQYIQLMRTAKKKPPLYTVYEYSHEDFLDFKALASKLGNNFNTNVEYEGFQFNDIKVFKVQQENPFEFVYKKSYLDDFKKVNIYQEKKKKNTSGDEKKARLPRKSVSLQNREETSLEDKIKSLKSWNQKRAYLQPAGISTNKKKDLMSLVNGHFIPRVYFDFYNSLKTKAD